MMPATCSWSSRIVAETLHDRIERDLIEERAQVLADLTAEERKLVIESIARLAGAASARVSTEAGCCVRN